MKRIYNFEIHEEPTAKKLWGHDVNVIEAYKQIRKSRIPFSLAIHSLMRNGRINGTGDNLRKLIANLRNDYKVTMTQNNRYVRLSRTVHGRTFETTYPLGVVKDNGKIIPLTRLRERAIHDIRESIRAYRDDLKRRNNPIFRRVAGGLLKEFQTKSLKLPKRPKDGSQYVGIEIECVTPNDADFSILLPFSKYINIGTDGSVEAGRNETGSEFRVCIKRDEVRSVLPGIMQAIKALGATVNKSCGLHVHMDQRHQKTREEVATVFQRLVRSLGLLYTVVPPSRRRNTYCKRNRHADFNRARDGERYKAVNAGAWERHGTLEVRLFGGTLEETKIINWIETLYAIAEGETVLRCPKTFDTALRYWKLSDENLAWLKDRQAKFSEANATMPVSENETEPNNHVMDEYEESEDESYCEHCDESGHYTEDCEAMAEAA